MARRSDHTRDELERMIIDAAKGIAEDEGLRGIGMRRIAAKIGYTPGTIYNVVGDLDQVILAMNAETLTAFRHRLQAVWDSDAPAQERPHLFAEAYLDFVFEYPRLWGVLFEHTLPEGQVAPDWYREILDNTVSTAVDALLPLFKDRETAHLSVATLWASLHGIATLSITNRLISVGVEDPRPLAATLIERFLAGAKG